MRKKVELSMLVLLLIGFTQAEAALPDTIYRVGATDTPGIPWGVFVQGDYAYIADRGRITIVDKSVPTTPWVRSSLNSGPPVAALGVFVRDTVAYLNPIGLGSSFVTVSVSNPDSLYILDWIIVSPSGGLPPTGVITVDTITYLAIGDDGLMMIDVSSPTSIDTIRSYNTPGLALDLSLKDTLVYIADFDSLQIINVVDPLFPVRVGAVGMPNGCQGIHVRDNLAYLVCQSSTGNDGSLQIVDISNPSIPQIIGNINNINGDPVDVHVQGTNAYVTASDHFLPNVEGGVRIIDISDSTNPILVASYETPGDPRGIFVEFPYIYVADQDSLQILEHIIVGIEEDLKKHKQKIEILTLEQNYPNPFNQVTSIKYHLPTSSRMSLKIYDESGRLIRTLIEQSQEVGSYQIQWDGRDDTYRFVNNGIYYYRLTSNFHYLTKKMIFLE
jgi:hypothetical protein